ncbi:MAG: radical SAM protein [Gammaproteobacteria bacterium]|nr:radical SAM protein [Gammaproteobacteria bacterium]
MSGGEAIPIDTVLLKTASRCNIACSYCYVYQLGDRGWQRQPPTMSESTIDATVRRLDELRRVQGRDFAVVLHGGEPLLLEETLLRRLLRGLRAGLPRGCTLSVQTNGTLLCDRRLDMLAEAGVTVSVSLDGPAKINDSRRVGFQGAGTFEATLEGIRRLQRHGAAERLFSGTLSVIDPSSDPSEVYWFLRGLGVPGMGFLLPDGNHSRLPPGKAGFDSHDAGAWLAGLFEVYMKDADPVPIRVLDDLVKLLLGGSATKEGMGRDLNAILIIDTDGTIRKNDTLKSAGDGADRYDEPWTVHSHSLREVSRTAAFREHVEMQHPTAGQCRRCPELAVCGGGMPLYRWSDERGFDNPSVYCADHLYLIARIRRYLDAHLPT